MATYTTKEERMYLRIRNLCGLLGIILPILAIFSASIVTRVTPCPGYWAMILEILLLLLFGFAWLVKGRAFPFLNDTEEDLKGGVRE